MFEFLPNTIPGCFEIRPHISTDRRGSFVKTFHRGFFAGYGLNIDWPEEYYTVSKKGAIRGLHFQLPPHDHEKLVYCVVGEVLDAVVDLRVGSPSFGQHVVFRLSANEANMVYIPRGLAHGFLTVSEAATMMYKVSSEYAQQHDTGILWSSAGIDWPVNEPIISQRDAGFVKLKHYVSPYIFNQNKCY